MRDLGWIRQANAQATEQARATRREALERVIANAERELKELEQETEGE